jgi:hypothetical protein
MGIASRDTQGSTQEVKLARSMHTAMYAISIHYVDYDTYNETPSTMERAAFYCFDGSSTCGRYCSIGK